MAAWIETAIERIETVIERGETVIERIETAIARDETVIESNDETAIERGEIVIERNDETAIHFEIKHKHVSPSQRVAPVDTAGERSQVYSQAALLGRYLRRLLGRLDDRIILVRHREALRVERHP